MPVLAARGLWSRRLFSTGPRPPPIFCPGDRFQVRWVAAELETAQMVDLQTIWDRADEQLVGESVCFYGTTWDRIETAVLVGSASCPGPTLILPTLVEFCEKPLPCRTLHNKTLLPHNMVLSDEPPSLPRPGCREAGCSLVVRVDFVQVELGLRAGHTLLAELVAVLGRVVSQPVAR